MKLIYTGYKWREATGMELLLRGDAEILNQIPEEPHAGDVYDTGKEEQLFLGGEYHPDPDFRTYTGWISTVGDLVKKLQLYDQDAIVRLSFRAQLPFGERINGSLPVECIGHGGHEDIDGKRVNVIYISGNGR